MPGRAGRNRTREPHYYWNNVASTQPDAQALAARLNLEFPSVSGPGYQSGLMYPVRRLITTGEDNDANLQTLLGPLWQAKQGEIVKKTRIEVLLCPPPGSPSHKMSEHYDAGSPRWTPRAPNAEEQAEMDKVKSMQARVAAQMGEKKEVESKDIKDILTSMGGDWANNLGALQDAMNSRDQGVGR